MNHAAWIVYECTGRWAAALRTQLARSDSSLAAKVPLQEVRSIPELGQRLGERQHSIALLEVTRHNLADMLDWLPTAGRGFPYARFVALLESPHQPPASASASDWALVTDALWEAGAAEIVVSPRQMQPLLEFGRRHFQSQNQSAARDAELLPIADWAWAALPWQDR